MSSLKKYFEKPTDFHIVNCIVRLNYGTTQIIVMMGFPGHPVGSRRPSAE